MLSMSFVKPVGAVLAAGALIAGTASITPAIAADPTFVAADPSSSAAESTSTGVGLTSASSKVVGKATDGKYIVQLAAAPLATYDGSVAGLAATRPATGAKLDMDSAAAAKYVAHLDAERAGVLAAAGLSAEDVFYDYNAAFAGFAVADISPDQARAIAASPDVVAVHANEMLTLDTTDTPTFLGLDEPETGLWDQLGGPDTLGGAGEDIVIGVVDGGFTPESGSFAPLDPPPATAVPDGWAGTCDPGDPDDLGGGPVGDGNTDGDQPAAIECDGDVVNSKVIGANYYVAGFGPPDPDEFLSPRDLGGHGSHTGSTSGGNYDVPITVGGADLGSINGMAPRARIAAYKVCWQTPTGGSCASADTTAAIDQAMEDGVDVINYSISGSLTSALTPQAIGFLNAAASGIYVAVSAGNSGPGLSTVAHNYPWVTTTAASTQDREFRVTVTLGNGDTYVGTGISTGVPETSTVYGGDIPAAGATPEDAARCFAGTLDDAEADGKIVLCDRGVNARTAKSAEVARAGGVGMILANDQASGASTNTERHAVPTAHVSYDAGLAIKAYLEQAGAAATSSLSAYEKVQGDAVTAPTMASFSSRGPSGVANGDLLKPDITAPGVDILATLAPYAGNAGEMYGFQSGTSMSSPHMAGLGALMRDAHPDWSPMAIKSALMTSAYQQNNQGGPISLGGTDATPLSYGAGHVDPNPAAATPAVYDSDVIDWIQFLCGAGQLPPNDPNCEAVGGGIDPSDLNYPSIAIGDLAGSQTVTRTLTNVTDAPLALASEIEVDGIAAVVTPAALAIEPGGSADFTVEFTRTDAAPLEEYTFGSLTWTDEDSRTIRSAIAIRPVGIGDVAELLVGEGSTGSVSDTVVSGINGQIDIELGGLEPSQVDSAVLTNPNQTFPDPPVERDDIYEIVYEVPEGAYLAHFALYEEDYVPTTDLDMYVYLDDELVALSATGVAGESVLLNDPEPGTYHVFIHLFSLAEGETEVEAHHHSWAVTDADVDEFSVEPQTFTGVIGEEQEVTYSWTDLAGPDGEGDQPSENLARYLGKGDYVDGTSGDDLARTVVRVDVGEGGGPGLAWELVETGSEGSFRGLDAVSDQVVWASSDSGEVLRTVDGGETFTDVAPPEGTADDLLFRDVEASSADEALVLAIGPGEASRVYRTVDGGATWTETFRGADPAGFFDCMSMFDRRHGIVMGDPVDGKFQILVTSDAGKTWTYAPESGMPDALAGEFGFAASGTCATTTGAKAFFGTGGGEEARVFRSDDFGQTWEVSSTPIQSTESGGIFSLDFRTNRLGLAIGGDFATPDEATDALARSTDGGVSWQLVDESVAPSGYRSGLAWYADRRGDTRQLITEPQKLAIAVGPSGSDASFDRGKSWEQFDDGAFHGVQCAGSSCWASGPDGRIAYLVGGP